MVAVESLYLAALLSAFIGLIALFVLSGAEVARTAGMKNFLVGVIVTAALVSVGSLFVYALSPHAAARSVYGSALASSTELAEGKLKDMREPGWLVARAPVRPN